MAVRIVLVDDHKILREGLTLLLQRTKNLIVVGEAGDGAEATACVIREKPAVVILDLQLPDEDGIATMKRILAILPMTRVLVLSATSDMSRVREALQAGAAGFLVKDDAADELVRAVDTVVAGKIHLSGVAASGLVQALNRPTPAAGACAPQELSERESTVLRLIVDGLRNKEIASQLGISPKSVETYRARVLHKLGCTSTAELVRYAVRTGFVRP